MMSIFPTAIGTTEVLTSKTIVIEASAVDWLSRTTWLGAVAPTQPTAAVDPDAAGAKKALMIGAASFVAVTLSLY